MNELIKDMLGKKVSIITNDGRHVLGVLKGADNLTNLILSQCVERVYSEDDGAQTVELGLYLLKGDNCAIVGLLNMTKDEIIDLATVRASPLKPIVHSGF